MSGHLSLVEHFPTCHELAELRNFSYVTATKALEADCFAGSRQWKNMVVKAIGKYLPVHLQHSAQVDFIIQNLGNCFGNYFASLLDNMIVAQLFFRDNQLPREPLKLKYVKSMLEDDAGYLHDYIMGNNGHISKASCNKI